MWVPLLFILVGSAGLVWLGWLGWQRRLPRQRWAGIRTPYSFANDAQWQAVNHFGAPYLIFGGVAGFAGALALFPFAVAGALPDGFATAAVLALAIIIGFAALMGWLLGTRAAKSSLSSQP